MAHRPRPFVGPLLLFAAACAAATWGVLAFLDQPMTRTHGGILVYFTMVTLALHAWQERGLADGSKGFAPRFMTGLVLKMGASLVLLVLLLLRVPRVEAAPTAVVFAALYLAFLSFSTMRSSGLIRKVPKP